MIDIELKNQITKFIYENFSKDEEIINLVITYLEKKNTAKKKQELETILEEIYQKFNNNEN